MRRYGLRKTHARKEEPKPEPAVTQEQLDELEPGDTVFHKAFGYGRIIDIDEAYIEVTFDSDDKKKKPSRKFLSLGRSPRVAADRIGIAYERYPHLHTGQGLGLTHTFEPVLLNYR